MNAPARLPTFIPTDRQIEANNLLVYGPPSILLRGGSRSGKTFIICRRIVTRALRASGSRHIYFRQHYNHAKASLGLDTFPKVLKLCFPELVGRVGFSHEGIAHFPNGSQFWLGGLDDKERVEKILGTEFATIYKGEISTMSYHASELASSRLAQKVEIDKDHNWRDIPEGERAILPLKEFYDMNPGGKRHWSYQLFVRKLVPGTSEPVANPDDYAVLLMNPDDNRANLPPEYFRTLDNLSAAKRKRFKEGEWANDVEGALWNDSTIEQARWPGATPELVRVVIGVDPSGSGTDKKAEVHKGNDIGIVVCGIDRHGIGYVLEDATVNSGPGEWAATVKNLGLKWKADKVVVESNYGGAMAEFTVKTVWPTAPIKMVVSSRGKALRAEPIAALYESNQMKVRHAGAFPDLEDQMAAMMPQPVGYTGEGSPDRLDAMVFALTELMLGGSYNLANLD